mgnify:CR=1 FL=1
MAYLNANIPPIYAQIRREYLYDCKKHHGEVEDCIVFGISSIAGSAILFPSTVTHRVTPVIKGTRYSIVVWFAGPPFV